MFAKFDQLRKRFTGQANKRNHKTIENSGLTRAQIDVGQKALKIIGLEDPNKLTKQDVIIFLYAVGLNPTDDVLDSKFRLMNVHTSELVTFPELCHIWHSMLQDLTDEEEILKRAFQFFDKDGNGDISVTELRETMHELGDLLTEQEIESFMQIMDVNNDGVIGYQEFLDTLKTQAPDAMVAEEALIEEEDEEQHNQQSPTQGPAAEAQEPSSITVGHMPATQQVSAPTQHVLVVAQQGSEAALLQPQERGKHPGSDPRQIQGSTAARPWNSWQPSFMPAPSDQGQSGYQPPLQQPATAIREACAPLQQEASGKPHGGGQGDAFQQQALSARDGQSTRVVPSSAIRSPSQLTTSTN